MNVKLSPSWTLTTEHAASSYGQPVLVHRTDGVAFGPGDIVKPYPSYGYMTAAAAVQRLAKTARLGVKGKALVGRFKLLGD